MATTISAVPFNGTKEQEQKLIELIAAHKGQRGALMPVLQGAQGIYGYLPIEVQKLVAQHLEIPLEEVYGVSTFYSQFTLNPKGKYKISVCLGHRLLRQRFRRRICQAGRMSGHPGWRMHQRRQILPGGLPLHRRVRSGAGYDHQRRRLRPPGRRRHSRHPGQIRGINDGRTVVKHPGYCAKFSAGKRHSCGHHRGGTAG